MVKRNPKRNRFDHLDDGELAARIKAGIAEYETETGHKFTRADLDAMAIMGQDPERMRRALIASNDPTMSYHEVYTKYYLLH
jgi:hypothetical protein